MPLLDVLSGRPAIRQYPDTPGFFVLHFDCHDAPAVLHHEIDFRPIVPPPEGKPTSRGYQARQKAQVMVDERFKVSAIFAVNPLIHNSQKERQPAPGHSGRLLGI